MSYANDRYPGDEEYVPTVFDKCGSLRRHGAVLCGSDASVQLRRADRDGRRDHRARSLGYERRRGVRPPPTSLVCERERHPPRLLGRAAIYPRAHLLESTYIYIYLSLLALL